MAIDIDGASTTVQDEEDVPTCTCSFWTVRDVPPSSHRHLDQSTPFAPASPPLLRHHGTRRACRSRSVFLRSTEHEQAPYTDPRTGPRYHDKNVYDLIKEPRAFSLSSRVQTLTTLPCRVPASQKTTSPPESPVPSSSSAGGSKPLIIQTGIWTFSGLYAVLVHEFIINRLRHFPCATLRFTEHTLEAFLFTFDLVASHKTKA